MVLRIEDISFIGIYINDSFRDFKDIDDYANYHVSLLNNKRYNAFTGDFIDRVVKGGYATDPNYKRALSNVYNQIAKAQVGMKIPKLQNAGELKARILRRFRQEKLDAHNEELIGFDWSRYKSYKPKPETTPTQSEQLENGGVIKIELNREAAPKTVENFEKLVSSGFYDGLTFHRIIKGFMIQGGDPEGTGMGGPGYGIYGEFSQNGFENPLKHERGVISMARSMMPNSAGSQFFIMHEDAPHLDGAYAAFGRVVEGMDVVDEIADTKTGYGDRPVEPIVMKKVYIEK